MAAIRKLTPRSTPVQKRAQERREQILTITAQLLEEVGQDDLTTILVAKTVGMSVGPFITISQTSMRFSMHWQSAG